LAGFQRIINNINNNKLTKKKNKPVVLKKKVSNIQSGFATINNSPFQSRKNISMLKADPSVQHFVSNIMIDEPKMAN